MKFPLTIRFDNGATEVCNSLKDAQEEILNYHSEQNFPEEITDADGNEYGSEWSVDIVEL